MGILPWEKKEKGGVGEKRMEERKGKAIVVH